MQKQRRGMLCLCQLLHRIGRNFHYSETGLDIVDNFDCTLLILSRAASLLLIHLPISPSFNHLVNKTLEKNENCPLNS